MPRDNNPHYPISYVRKLITENSYDIKPPAQKCARNLFGYGEQEILTAIRTLRPKEHFAGKKLHWDEELRNAGVFVDHYRAPGFNGIDLYTHFHVEDGELQIVSFKDIDEEKSKDCNKQKRSRSA